MKHDEEKDIRVGVKYVGRGSERAGGLRTASFLLEAPARARDTAGEASGKPGQLGQERTKTAGMTMAPQGPRAGVRHRTIGV